MLDFGYETKKDEKQKDNIIHTDIQAPVQEEKSIQESDMELDKGPEFKEKAGKEVHPEEYDPAQKLQERKAKAELEQGEIDSINAVKSLEGDLMLPGNPEREYESQGIGTNNCYACTAVAMINQHMKNKVPPSDIRVNQDDIRAYTPKFDYDTYKGLHTGGDISKKTYYEEADKIKSYCGIDKTQPGNIFALSDLFLQLDPTASMNYLGLEFKKSETENYARKKAYFIKIVKQAISNGEAVGFLNNGSIHYLTIIGIVGDTVKYLDSNIQDYNKVQSCPVDQFLPEGQVELTWISNEEKDVHKLADKYGELYISEDDHKLHSNNVYSANDHGRLLGLNSQFSKKEKEKEGADSSISHEVTRIVYVPGKEDIQPFDLDKHRATYEAQKPGPQDISTSSFTSKAAKMVSKKHKNEDKGNDGEKDENLKEKKQQTEETEISTKSQEAPAGPVIVQIPANLGIDRYAKNFAKLPKGKSESYLQFADALEYADPLIQQIAKGEYTHDAGNYAMFQELYMAAERYYHEHRNNSGTDVKQRCEVAYWILYTLDFVTNEITRTQKLNEKEKVIEASPEEEGFAKENVGRFTGAYFAYCKRVDQELITTPDDKLVKKWNAIKTIERDLLIYFKNGNRLSDSEDEKQLFFEYKKLKQQMKIRNLLIKDEEKKEDFGNEGLRQEQLSALSRVDTWIIRNIRNGGWFKYLGGLSISDRTDIATKLMSMPKRQRLYAYYLVETNERVKISDNGLARSQFDYVPDVKAIKDRMIPNRAKFYLRFSGSYIYWHKLTQAMGIASGSASLIKTAEKYLGLNEDGSEKKLDPNPAPDFDKMKPEDKQKEHIRLIMVNYKQAILLMKRKEELKKEPAKNKAQIDKIDAELKRLSKEGKAHLKAIDDILKELDQHTGTIERSITRADVTEGIKSPLGKVTSLMLLASPNSWRSLFQWKVTQLVDFTSQVDTFTAIYSGGISGLSIAGGILGSVLTMMNLYEAGDSLSDVERFAQAGSVGSAAGYLLKDTANIVALSTSTGSTVHDVATLASSAYVGLTMAAVDTTFAVVKGASLTRDSYYRRSAARLAAGKTKPDKFRDGMLRLNEKLAARQRISTFGSGVTAAVTLTGYSLIVGGVASLGLSLIPGLLALGIGIGMKAIDSRYSRKMKLAIFDSYFEVDKVVENEKADYKKRYPNRPLTKEQEERIYTQVRGKIASEKGFYSPGHAAKAIATQYADYLLKNIECNNSDAEMCKAMIRGLGLKYKEDPDDPDNTVPTRSDIVKKLCG